MDNRTGLEKGTVGRTVAACLRAWLPKVFLVVPMILGLIGFSAINNGFTNDQGQFDWQILLDAAFNCLTMYGLNYGREPDQQWNVLLELARWLAPVATASGLVMVFARLRSWVRRFVAHLSLNSTAVYGSPAEKAVLLEELGPSGIDMGERFVRARRYILLGTEEENLALYGRYHEALKDRHVYLKTSALPAQQGSSDKLHLFSPEERAARGFGKQHCAYDKSVAADEQMKIVLVGFGKLGRELLLSGLQYNIFHPKQRIEYHVFGDAEGFEATYWQLPQISDPVVFYKESCFDHVPLLRQADMIIVAEQNDQLALVQKLTMAAPQQSIYVLAANMIGTQFLQGPVYYDWKSDTLHMEKILGLRLNELAKRLNLHYAAQYPPEGETIEETDEYLEPQWAKLSSFHRYSNISAAEFHDVCARILGDQELTAERLDFLGELEHIRWCRYHYLNNWQYGPVRNNAQKIHHLLVPYEELSEGEKEKDRRNVKLLMELNSKMQG